MHTFGFFARRRPAAGLALGVVLCVAPAIYAQELKPIQLPRPETAAGMPLMQALSERKTTRAFMDKPLSTQALSNLLWAAFGVNRARDQKPGLGRTAPSAMNKQEVELDVVLASGVYVYEAEANRLRPVAAGDMRSKICPSAARHAAVTLVYVADAENEFAQVDTGFIGQNVYLFAASEGLNAWFYTLHELDAASALKLLEGRKPLYAQSIGFPPR
jgi:nitroreductase